MSKDTCSTIINVYSPALLCPFLRQLVVVFLYQKKETSLWLVSGLSLKSNERSGVSEVLSFTAAIVQTRLTVEWSRQNYAAVGYRYTFTFTAKAFELLD